MVICSHCNKREGKDRCANHHGPLCDPCMDHHTPPFRTDMWGGICGPDSRATIVREIFEKIEKHLNYTIDNEDLTPEELIDWWKLKQSLGGK